jgi:hypothetical protein
MMNAISARSATFAGCAIVILLVAGCGTEDASTGSAGDSLASLVEAKAINDDLLALDVAIDGSLEERRAADFLTFASMSDPIRDCMAAHDQPYRNPFIDHLYQRELQSSEEFVAAPLNSDVALHNVQADAGAARRDQVAGQWRAPDDNGPESPYSKALNACFAAPQEHFVDPDFTRTADKLDAAKARMLAAIDEQIGGHEAYDDCMSAAGFDVTDNPDGIGGYQGMLESLLVRAPAADAIPSVGSDETTSAWDNFTRTYHAEVSADAACRTDTFLAAMQILKPRLAAFREDHASELSATSQGWDDVEQEAVAHGFDAAAPPDNAD